MPQLNLPPYTPPQESFDYQQGKDYRWASISPDGVCIALSTYWVIKKENQVDYLQWLEPLQQASSKGQNAPQKKQEDLEKDKKYNQIATIMNKQSQHSQVMSQSGMPKDLSFMLWAGKKIAKLQGGNGNTNLSRDGDMVTLQSKPWYDVAAEVAVRDGYVLFSFRVDVWGAHVCAAYIQTPIVAFFDPNYGEYHFQDIYSFKKWFKEDLMIIKYSTIGKICDRSRVLHFK